MNPPGDLNPFRPDLCRTLTDLSLCRHASLPSYDAAVYGGARGDQTGSAAAILGSSDNSGVRDLYHTLSDYVPADTYTRDHQQRFTPGGLLLTDQVLPSHDIVDFRGGSAFTARSSHHHQPQQQRQQQVLNATNINTAGYQPTSRRQFNNVTSFHELESSPSNTDRLEEFVSSVLDADSSLSAIQPAYGVNNVNLGSTTTQQQQQQRHQAGGNYFGNNSLLVENFVSSPQHHPRQQHLLQSYSTPTSPIHSTNLLGNTLHHSLSASGNSLHQSPGSSLHHSPSNSLHHSPGSSLHNSPGNPYHSGLSNCPHPSQANSLHNSPGNTLHHSPLVSGGTLHHSLSLTENLSHCNPSISGGNSLHHNLSASGNNTSGNLVAMESPLLPGNPMMMSGGFHSLNSQHLGNSGGDIMMATNSKSRAMDISERKKIVARRSKKPPPSPNKSPQQQRPAPSTQLSPQKPLRPIDDYSKFVNYVPECLEKFGFCVVDKFAGRTFGTAVMNEVCGLYKLGAFEDGLLTTQAFASTEVRGDRVFWLEKEDSNRLVHICQLLRRLDNLFLQLHGRLGEYHITSRSKAMLACYPAEGRGYRRHVDNPNQDGRVITAIYYLNQNWEPARDGGILRMFPALLPENAVDVEPIFDRVVFFWSDHRTPHEVQPSYRPRYAVTIWYFDDAQRQQARLRLAQQGSQDENPRLASVALTTVDSNQSSNVS